VLAEPDVSALGAAMLGAAAAEGTLAAGRPLRGGVEIARPVTDSVAAALRLGRFRRAARVSLSWQKAGSSSSQQ
jgi:hypothetical protein